METKKNANVNMFNNNCCKNCKSLFLIYQYEDGKNGEIKMENGKIIPILPSKVYKCCSCGSLNYFTF